MIPSIQRSRWLPWVVATSLFLAACGDDGGEDEAGGENGGGNERPTEEREPLPLQEWWASLGGSGEARRERDQRVEGRIADCMQSQGFEYTPVEPHPGATDASGGSGPWSLSPQEFAERYGYGLFTLEGTAGVDDPNGSQLASMSESEREAYVAALSDEGGCLEEALTQEFEESAGEELVALEEEVIALEERVAEDRRVQDAARQWANCMADAGYEDLSEPDEALDVVVARFEELMPDAAANAELESTPRPDGTAVHRMRGVTLSALDEQALEDLQDHEIEVATADHDCRAEYDDARYEVQFELEQQFMQDNAAMIDRVTEVHGANTGGE